MRVVLPKFRSIKLFSLIFWCFPKIILILQSQRRLNGSLAEWLGAGLQNRLQQFDSARNLTKTNPPGMAGFVISLT